MPYTLYTDRNENFECEVSVKNASLKGSMARLIVESAEGVNLVFNGKIEGGKCVVPIRRLKGLIDENVKGKMFLEVIVEDTYFKPWQSEFGVEEHTSVKVKFNESKQSTKPIVEVKVDSTPDSKKKKNGINMWLPLYEIKNLCEKFGIKRSNLAQRKTDFHQLIQEYFDANPEFRSRKTSIMGGLKHFIK